MSTLESDIDTMENALRLFFQTIKRPQYWAEVARQAGVIIDRPSALILRTLLQEDSSQCHVQQLANHLGIEAPSVTRKTQELELLGYLERQRDPKDKRAVGLVITASGRAVAHKLQKAQRQALRDALHELPDDERSQLVSLFEKFSSRLSKTTKTTTNN